MRELLRKLFLLCVLLCSGCVVPQGPDAHELHEAQRLLDQGTLFLRAQDFERAQASFLMAYEIAHLPQAVDGLGCVAFRQGDKGTAERLFQQAFDLDRSQSQPLANLALLYEARGDTASAAVLYQRVLSVDPQNVMARNNYSALLYDQKSKTQAREELLKAQAVIDNPLINENVKTVDSE